MVRRSDGGKLVEAFVVIAVITILVTRAYLAATGYPQIGGGNLHIAHSLFGGALLAVAMFITCSFTGRDARYFAVVTGGIGFGLFLDEVGKFVTSTNDYFYKPSFAIMYVVIVILLLANHIVADVNRISRTTAVVNASSTATDALAGGIPDYQRAEVQGWVQQAGAAGADPGVVDGLSTTLAAAPGTKPSILDRIARGVSGKEHSFQIGSVVPLITGILLTVFVTSGLIHGVSRLPHDTTFERLRFAGAVVATALCVLALISLLTKRGGIWPLRVFRTTALLTMLLTQVFSFVNEQLGALINVGIGLLALGIFSTRIRELGGDDPIVIDPNKK